MRKQKSHELATVPYGRYLWERLVGVTLRDVSITPEMSGSCNALTCTVGKANLSDLRFVRIFVIIGFLEGGVAE